MKGMIIPRTNDEAVFVSPHMQQRLKERKGLNKKAIKRYILKALEFGEVIQSTVENDRKKISALFKNDCLIYYIGKGMINFVTILVDKPITKTAYVQGRVKKMEYIPTPFMQGLQ